MTAAGNSRIVALGECMLRLSVPPGETLEEARQFEVFIGGAEANVAVALARLNRRVAMVTRVGGGPHGRRVTAHLARHGVDTSWVTVDERRRTGLYFTESAGAPRGVSVVYDRADSAATALAPEDLTSGLFDGAAAAVVSGITPALSPSCRAATERFMELAVAAGVQVVLDINYRARLWEPDVAAAVLEPLCRSASAVLCSSEDARHVFGVDGNAALRARALSTRVATQVVVTDGADGVAWSGSSCGSAPAISTETLDRIGAGDAFCAGVVDGLLDDDLELGIRRGQAMASLKRTMSGDCFLGTRSDVDRVLALVDGNEVRAVER